MEAAEQAHLRPPALFAPFGGDHRLVDHGAQQVARSDDLAAFRAIVLGTCLELLEPRAQPFMECR
ncbi:hypothetical protein D3C77_611730 [compost metagenome]